MSGKGGGWEESEPSGRYTKSAKMVKGLEILGWRRGRVPGGVRDGWEVSDCRETPTQGSRLPTRLLHIQSGPSSPWQNLSSFIGAAVTLLIGY